MKQGPDKVLECPNCKTAIIIFTLASGNTVDAQTWTDGKMIAPMLPQLPAITKCSTCTHFFWLCEAKVLGEIPLWGPELDKIPENWKKAERVRDLTEIEYLEAISKGAALNRDQELYLRLGAWWAGNDPQRDMNHTTEASGFIRTQEGIHNLKRFSGLLDENNPRERLFKAEAMRELGLFSEALNLLVFNFPKEYENNVNLIRDLAEKKDFLLREIIE